MYFATNAVTSSIVGAISGSLIYEYVKNLFISKEASGVVWAQTTQDAAAKFGLATASSVYNLGNLLVPFIVCITCIIGFFIAKKMPKDYTPSILAREFKKMDPSIDISKFENMEEPEEEKDEIIFVQVGLSILSGFLFGFVWQTILFGSIKKLTGKGCRIARWLLSAFVPFAGIFVMLRARKELTELAAEKGVKITLPRWLVIATSVVFPILPINVIALAFFQHAVNKIYVSEKK
jgi:hypothetical protein